MPIYDLVCGSCPHKEELFSLSVVIDVQNKCPNCDVVLMKQIPLVRAIFKGSGFYATEHGNAKFNSFKESKKEITERDEFIDLAKKDMP